MCRPASRRKRRKWQPRSDCGACRGWRLPRRRCRRWSGRHGGPSCSCPRHSSRRSEQPSGGCCYGTSFCTCGARDHLVRWFEVGVVGLYWWNPVAWWAVARLQQAEEDCCDAAILVAHPHDSARYGETLVSVAQFLSAGTLPTPSLSLGVARNGHIKRRLTMILHGPRWPELSTTRLAAFCLLGAALVAVTWTAAKLQSAPRIVALPARAHCRCLARITANDGSARDSHKGSGYASQASRGPVSTNSDGPCP